MITTGNCKKSSSSFKANIIFINLHYYKMELPSSKNACQLQKRILDMEIRIHTIHNLAKSSKLCKKLLDGVNQEHTSLSLNSLQSKVKDD